MAFQRVPETVEAAINFSQQSVPMQNTFHARMIGGYAQQDLEDLADALDEVVDTYWLPLWSTQLTYSGVTVRGLDSIVDLEASNGDSAGTGGISGTPIPNQNAFCVKKLSGFTGRSARGRVYIGGLITANLDANENFFGGAAAANWVAAVDAVKDAMDGLGWIPVIVSRFSDGAKREEAVTFEWVTTAYGSLRIDSRRDRMPVE